MAFIFIIAATLSIPGFVESSFDSYFPSRTKTQSGVAAHMSVPSISILAAALPVGAAAKQFIPRTTHQKCLAVVSLVHVSYRNRIDLTRSSGFWVQGRQQKAFASSGGSLHHYSQTALRWQSMDNLIINPPLIGNLAIRPALSHLLLAFCEQLSKLPSAAPSSASTSDPRCWLARASPPCSTSMVLAHTFYLLSVRQNSLDSIPLYNSKQNETTKRARLTMTCAIRSGIRPAQCIPEPST